jgi:hypothetical protein
MPSDMLCEYHLPHTVYSAQQLVCERLDTAHRERLEASPLQNIVQTATTKQRMLRTGATSPSP